MEELEHKSILEAVANLAEFANSVASMVVGHRKILVEGGFDINLADQMAAALHAQVLGLVHLWQDEDEEEEYHIVAYPNDEDDDE